MAHLIRDVKFLTTLPDRATETYGGILPMRLRDLFALLHRRDRMNPTTWKHALHRKRDAILAMATYRVPPTAQARAMARPTSSSSTPPAWRPPTTPRNKPFALW